MESMISNIKKVSGEWERNDLGLIMVRFISAC